MTKTGSATKDDYAVSTPTAQTTITAPVIAYQPSRPKKYRPRIGMIGCGGITEFHCQAYTKAGYEVVALTDLDASKAKARQAAFYPRAEVVGSAADILARPDVDIVDLALHPRPRESVLRDAIAAGKHILSQKPFVVDLDFGQKVVQAACDKAVKLAVNQNGRWAPHVSWMRQAIAGGAIGQVTSVDMLIAWNHNWVAGTPFDNIPQLVLYDFAIHWFDMLHCYTRGQTCRRVVASLAGAPGQKARPPLLAQVALEFDHAQASMQFRASTAAGPVDRTVIVGAAGTLISEGPNLNTQVVTLYTPAGQVSPTLEGSWFPDGFDGTMSELVCAIEDDREPYNSGADNLESLAMAFAAIASTERGQPVAPGAVRRLEDRWLDDAGP